MEIGLVEGVMPRKVGETADLGGIKLFDESGRGELRIGGSFASEIILEKAEGSLVPGGVNT